MKGKENWNYTLKLPANATSFRVFVCVCVPPSLWRLVVVVVCQRLPGRGRCLEVMLCCLWWHICLCESLALQPRVRSGYVRGLFPTLSPFQSREKGQISDRRSRDREELCTLAWALVPQDTCLQLQWSWDKEIFFNMFLSLITHNLVTLATMMTFRLCHDVVIFELKKLLFIKSALMLAFSLPSCWRPHGAASRQFLECLHFLLLNQAGGAFVSSETLCQLFFSPEKRENSFFAYQHNLKHVCDSLKQLLR